VVRTKMTLLFRSEIQGFAESKDDYQGDTGFQGLVLWGEGGGVGRSGAREPVWWAGK